MKSTLFRQSVGTTRGAAALLAAAAVTTVLAGCTPAAQSGGSSSGTGSTSSGAASPTASSSSASLTGSGGSGGGTPECKLADLGASLGPKVLGLGPGDTEQPLVLKNVSSSACFVVGFPGVAALNGGAQVYQATRVNGEGGQVTLAPGAVASAMLGYQTLHTAPSSSACGGITGLLVTPPDDTHSTQLSLSTPMCAAPTITTLAAGTYGGDATVAQTLYSEAQQQWESGVNVDSADQGENWTQAAALLNDAVSLGAPGTTNFSQAAQDLTELAALPDADQNPGQQQESIAYTNYLNTFFNTPGLYS
jgi:hypothetical protein